MRKSTISIILLGAWLGFFAGAAAGQIPKPESVFGFMPGADLKLSTYDLTIAYLRDLAAASPYLKLVEAGRTTQGRTVYFALVSDPNNLEMIDRFREIDLRLAHPEGLTDEAARALAEEGKAIVHIDGGCHATEVAGPQMIPQLAYDLVAGADDPRIRLILNETIVLLWPTMNPDGQQMVGEWNAKNAGTPYAEAGLPVLYQDYVGHDNNRDGYMLNMIESRLMEHFWRQWEPQIIYVHHQTAPFPTRIWLPPFADPVGLHAPAISSREVNMIGMAIAKGLEERGQRGATHMGSFDAWYPGYVDYAPIFKNIPSFWTETAGNMAVPREYAIDTFPTAYRDFRPQSLYLSPWTGGWWRLGDAVAYNETASLSVLEYAARYKASLLYNRYQAGRDQIVRGRSSAPYAYIIPREQRDPVAAVELLRRLAFGGVRVHQLTLAAMIDGREYPAGTWIVPTDQEFAAMARELLDVQKYPDLRVSPGGRLIRPYDAAGWTLPLQMGVSVTTAAKPLDAEVRTKMTLLGPKPDPKSPFVPYNLKETADPADFDSVPGIGFDSEPAAAAIVPPTGSISGRGPALLVDPAQNNAYRAINRAWKAGAKVRFLAAPSGSKNGGRFVISGLSRSAEKALVEALTLKAERTEVKGVPLAKPRIGVFEPWGGSMDAGWTRWLLERYEFDFVTLRPEDFQKPLSGKIDVLILAADVRIPIAPSATPAPAAPAGQAGGDRPRGRTRVVRPEHAYNLTPEDLKRFEDFIRTGGRLVCFDASTRFAIQQLKLPVKNAAETFKPEEYYQGGSILEAAVDPADPLMAGMPAKAAIFVDGSPVFETLEGFKGTIPLRFASEGSPLLSGLLVGEKNILGKAAAVAAELGKGRIILFGFCPQWRAQPFGTFRLVFNAALFGR